MTDHSIRGKVALIAGGAKNLGGLIARDLAQQGASAVAIHYNSDASRADAEKTVKVPAWLNDVTLYHNRGNSHWVGESSVYGDFSGLDDLATEHPRVVAERIERYANIIGRERVIAGTDCSFSTFAGFGVVDPEIVWAKLATLAEGAALASERLWRGVAA